MKDIEQEKKLTPRQIRLIQLLLLIIGGVFLLFFFFSILHKDQGSNKSDKLTNVTVYYQNQQLHVFNDVIQFKNSADRLALHGEYLLVSEPFINKTHIYSLKKHKREKDIEQIVLDFDGKNIIYANGISTFFNGKDLRNSCFGGFIKSPTEVLCIVPKADDNLDNKLLSINPQTLQKTDVYSSGYTLNYVTVIDGTVFIGGYSLQKKENVLIVNGKVVQVPTRVALVYKNNDNIYVASFQNNLNNNSNKFYQIKQEDTNITTSIVGKDKILLY